MYSESNLPEADALAEQARAMISLLPAVMRSMFRLDDDLATELPLAQLRVCALLLEGPRPMSFLSRETGVTFPASALFWSIRTTPSTAHAGIATPTTSPS